MKSRYVLTVVKPCKRRAVPAPGSAVRASVAWQEEIRPLVSLQPLPFESRHREFRSHSQLSNLQEAEVLIKLAKMQLLNPREAESQRRS
jgi:hypothetical protein